MDWYLFQFEPRYLLVVAVRLLVACVLGGIVGFEREHNHHKPAGFRTHILVCMGACLVMMISEFSVVAFKGVVNVEPTRIGAQVVSGIGFLGAGAIIRHGTSVRGITTAASIWAVACIGIACGIGFYTAAVLATILTWAILIYLKLIEKRLHKKKSTIVLSVEAREAGNREVSWEKELEELGLQIESMDTTRTDGVLSHRILCKVKKGKQVEIEAVVRQLMHIEGVTRVSL
ncbi:MAG TPA: MgtC/SapB family protein [Thermoclostridium caenicola]|nr:MgtC/SapB family protein [Thermoclostridium caenicola]HOL85349.1 MgtC/SapB family protein [Thermoclostridium caenicola]HOP72887.1 MgtC/SapB family protein [Thermoclostridium caenicola]HPO75749.1 MgtC/SapB family protein [Thermoclostridium caenicola]HPU22139.1 MgtC/SapB family protein [Thermoclostridium caenicola]